ncbi:hypothetical protein EVAR_99833_1 [Eumeta japonica]|uniref:Uncharacterized protein n=1 Tax=Eumeta variegata TaxID=151549 RepID=A0A4C1ZDH2_EUMVA|nr:hypothetical protein EVAR_99833_1 [Eumeta japonica]
MSDVPDPSKRFSTDNSLISVAKKRRKINQDSSLDKSDCSSEEAAYSQRNDEDQSDTSEDRNKIICPPHDAVLSATHMLPGRIHGAVKRCETHIHNNGNKRRRLWEVRVAASPTARSCDYSQKANRSPLCRDSPTSVSYSQFRLHSCVEWTLNFASRSTDFYNFELCLPSDLDFC